MRRIAPGGAARRGLSEFRKRMNGTERRREPLRAATGVGFGRLALCDLQYRLDARRGRKQQRGYNPEYWRSFPRFGRFFLGYLKRWGALPAANGHREPVAVVIMPWVETPAPWYAIMLAIGLVRRGRDVVLVWDDTGFPERGLTKQNLAIGRVLAYVGRVLPVVRVSTQPSVAMVERDVQLVDTIAVQNFTWKHRGAQPSATYESRLTEIRDALTNSLPLIRGTLDHLDVDLVVVPGGVYGTSGLFRLLAAERGCRAATFDATPTVAKLCVDGVAAQATDIPRAFAALLDSDVETRRVACKLAEEEFDLRQAGLDRRTTQVVASQSTSNSADCVLIPLNVEWDTAALGMHAFFADTVDWVTSTVAEVLQLDDAGPVVVRQHPAERHKASHSQLDMASILLARFGDDERVRFVSAGDPVSTYDLIRSARVVLPFVSTIGIEAAAMGRPVVPSGSAYYADLGFVWAAASRDDYLGFVRRGVRGTLPLLPDQTDRAWLCYYLTTICNPVPTDFTGTPSDFPDWIRRAPDELFADPAVSDLLEALDRDIPVSLVRHARISSSR